MKEQVTDISAMLESLTKDVQSMRETIDAQHTEIVSLKRNVDRLRKENRDLRKRLSKYEDPDKNSCNSSVPPSKERMKDEVIRRTKTLRAKSGLEPGGQPGHDGHFKKMEETPDVVEDCMSNFCRECGRDLSDIAGELDYVSQVVDLSVIVPVITEYRHYKKVCTCGCCNKGYEPRKRGSQITFGRNIRAIVTYLNVVQCIPFDRLATLMDEVFSVHLSQGTIENFVQETMRKSQPAIKLLGEMLKKSPVVGFERLRKGLFKCRDYIFNFLENPMIPSDNNASERGIRKLKVKQKISGTFRSDNGADAFFAIHSIADTARKNKQSQLEAISTILAL